MTLTATSRSCFGDHYVIHLGGRPVAEFTGRWFSTSIDIRRAGGVRYHFEHRGLFRSRCTLIMPDGRILATTRSSGISSRWTLEFPLEPHGSDLTMVSSGWLSTGYQVYAADHRPVASATTGSCTTGWSVTPARDAELSETQLLVIGLVYHTILLRRRQSAAAAS